MSEIAQRPFIAVESRAGARDIEIEVELDQRGNGVWLWLQPLASIWLPFDDARKVREGLEQVLSTVDLAESA